jgi:lysozyme C
MGGERSSLITRASGADPSMRCRVGQIHVRLLAVAMVSLTSIAGCAAETPGDDSEPVGESQDHLLAGRRLSQTEAATLIRKAGFPESVVGKMLCTIKYESNFYERASNKNNNGSSDYGLFQVNSIHFHDAGCPSSAAGLYDAAANTKCALAIYKSQGINAWYGYKKHRSECDSYGAPAASGAAAPPNGTADPTPDDPTDATEGGCYSGTLEEMVPEGTCVESKFDGEWYQCKATKWTSGGASGTGPVGACVSKHPL